MPILFTNSNWDWISSPVRVSCFRFRLAYVNTSTYTVHMCTEVALASASCYLFLWLHSAPWNSFQAALQMTDVNFLFSTTNVDVAIGGYVKVNTNMWLERCNWSMYLNFYPLAYLTQKHARWKCSQSKNVKPVKDQMSSVWVVTVLQYYSIQKRKLACSELKN